MELTWFQFPVLLLAAGLLFEVGLALRRCGSPAAVDRLPLLRWLVRPWTCWAALNLLFRARHEDGFNNHRTFPFFANMWRERETWMEAGERLAACEGLGGWVALALCGSALAGLLAYWCATLPQLAAHRAALAALVGMAALLPALMALVPAGPRRALDHPDGPLSPWFETGGTMLHAMPFVKSTDHFLRNFEAIQPRLEISIHGLSHPPLATLTLDWLGQLTGARGERDSVRQDRLRYALALTLFSALGVLAAYLFGAWWTADRRAGLITAVLWMAKPAALAHNTFAQDGVYTVFFIAGLALSWRVTTRPARSWGLAVGLGVVFALTTQLSYSWCILTSLFAAFALWHGIRTRWSRLDWLVRLLAPLVVLAALLGLFLRAYRLDYLAIYFTSSFYVASFYTFANAYQWIMALVGGQLAILVMLGAITASWFVARVLPGWWRERTRSPAAAFALIVLGVYLIPILVGPACLKMETERCWSWITVLPLAGVAQAVAARADAPRVLVWLLAAGLLPYLGARLFICFLS